MAGPRGFHAVLLCLGDSSRLKPLSEGDHYPPLLPVLNQPLLSYTMSLLSSYNMHSVHLVVAGADAAARIEAWVAHRFSEPMPGIRVSVVPDESDTADALRQVLPLLPSAVEDILLLSSDIICNVSLGSLAAYHRREGASVTMVVQGQASAGVSGGDGGGAGNRGGSGSGGSAGGGGGGGGGKRGSGSSSGGSGAGGAGGSSSKGSSKDEKKHPDIFLLGGSSGRRILSFCPGADAPSKELKVRRALLEAWGSVDLRSDLINAGVYAVNRVALENALLARPSASSFLLEILPAMVRAQSLPPLPAWIDRAAELEPLKERQAEGAGDRKEQGGGEGQLESAVSGLGIRDGVEDGKTKKKGHLHVHQSGAAAPSLIVPGEVTSGSLSSSYAHSAAALLAPLPATFNGHTSASSQMDRKPAGSPVKGSARLGPGAARPCFAFMLPDGAFSGTVDSPRSYFDVNHALRAQPASLPWQLPPAGPHSSSALVHDSVVLGVKTKIGTDSAIGDGTSIGDKCIVKKSIIGRHCVLGADVKVDSSIMMDHVVIGEHCVVTSSVLSHDVTLQPYAKVVDRYIGPGSVVDSDGNEDLPNKL